MNLTTEKIINICQDIKADNDWVNDSLTASEYKGVCDGLNRLVKHLKETDKDLNSKINVYAYWLLQACDDPVGEIEWLVNLALDDSSNSKKQMLDVLEIHKNHENN